MHKYTSGFEFENEVRGIARQLFSSSIGEGAENVDGRERDGVFWNGDVYTVIEATLDRSKEKAEYDAKKTNDLVNKKRREGNLARGYLVTLDEPTVHQKEVVKKYDKTVKIIGFDEFRSMLFDVYSYVSIRSKRPFGSVYNHVSESYEVPFEEFVEPTLESKSRNGVIYIAEIYSDLISGNRFIFTAEYGVGKSMLLRELFRRYCADIRSKNTFRIPIVINLREHMGQSNHIELLERHARSVGVDARKLVAAWAAGYVDLLIDGFDELSTRGWTGDPKKIKEYRRSTHAVIRNLIKSTPSKSAIVIAGRGAYFDSDAEMREALGANASRFDHVSIRPFDDAQAMQFLSKKGFSGPLPDWVPTRPLLLNYLVTKGLLKDAVTQDYHGAFSRGAAWVSLIKMISARESDQSEGIDSATIIRFLSALALAARRNVEWDATFTPLEIDNLFFEISGYTVSEEERHILLRLPGLGAAPEKPSNRMFVDEDFMHACAAFQIYQFIEAPYNADAFSSSYPDFTSQVSETGLDVICELLNRSNIDAGMVVPACRVAIERSRHQLAYDVFNVGLHSSKPVHSLQFIGITIREIDLCEDHFDSVDVKFSDCIIERVNASGIDQIKSRVVFESCLIGTVEGLVSDNDLPRTTFHGCEVDEYTNEYSVNNDVLSTSLPLGVRVLVVTLRKIFTQSGSARLESALVRGLDHRARMLAPDVIENLRKHHFVVDAGRQGKVAYSGNRAKRKDALSIIQSPNSYQHPIIRECAAL